MRGIINRFESTRNQDEKELLKKIKMAEKNNDFELLEKLLSKRQKMAVLKEKKKMSPIETVKKEINFNFVVSINFF